MIAEYTGIAGVTRWLQAALNERASQTPFAKMMGNPPGCMQSVLTENPHVTCHSRKAQRLLGATMGVTRQTVWGEDEGPCSVAALQSVIVLIFRVRV
jgi:hypothetical protein